MPTIEETRESFRLDKIKVLMVAESPPASGKFFYLGDDFAVYTMKAFEKVVKKQFPSVMDFLDYFKSKGLYLEDLCLEPVNKLPADIRENKREEGVTPLSVKIKEWQPRIIICCMKAISIYVVDAIRLSEVNNFNYYTVPYPRQRNIPNYIEQLSILLVELNKCGFIELNNVKQ